jgi:antitoxin component YwqK of YwqJK toxin-antitoxin module
VFTSDDEVRDEGFDISRISFRDSDLGEETTVDVEITDGAGNYSNNAELRWNVDIPAPAQKVEYHIYRDPANNSPTKHGTYESFYEDGSFYETGTYTNGHKDGFWTGFYPNGTTRYKYCWKVKSDGSAGVLHGPSIDYNKDGSIRSEYQYSDGNKHGEFVEYHSTGTFHLKGSYKGDNRDGLWEEWADDGTKKKEYNFSEGIKEGQYKEYDNSGNLVIEGEYKEGRNWNGEFFVHVEWQEYDDNEDESEFAGYWTALVESGKEGVPGRFTYSEGVWNGNAIIYDEDGNIASEENYVAGALEGPTVVYDEDGNVTWHVEYKAGKVDGKITRFSDDGTKISEYSYSEGIRNGEFVEYYPNGTARRTGSYKENVLDGPSVYYEIDGTIEKEETWEDGVCSDGCLSFVGSWVWFYEDGSEYIWVFSEDEQVLVLYSSGELWLKGTWAVVDSNLRLDWTSGSFEEYAIISWESERIEMQNANGFTIVLNRTEDDDSSPTSSSVSQDDYSETIVGTWKWYGEPHWTFSSDGTVEFVGDVFEITYSWEISGSTLTITNPNGNLWGEYPIEIKSMSDTQFVYINKIDKVDGSGTVEEEVTHTR